MTLKFEGLSVELGDVTSTVKGALLITHLGTTETEKITQEICCELVYCSMVQRGYHMRSFLRTTVSRRAFSGSLLKACMDVSVEPC